MIYIRKRSSDEDIEYSQAQNKKRTDQSSISLPTTQYPNTHAICTDDGYRLQDAPLTNAEYFVMQMLWPTENAPVTTKFGAPNTRGGPGIHAAVDIGAESGSFVYAVADGRIVWAKNDKENGGNKIVIEHDSSGEKFYSMYFHLGQIDEQAFLIGLEVKAGSIIGQVGDSGSVGAPHLHFEIRTANGVEMGEYGSLTWSTWTEGYFWANSKSELNMGWVDISSRFGGYDGAYPFGGQHESCP
ncbi:MAG: M23 family metallopeptidase [Chloroflexi bacterium]|nr:M23 family metallopeptidase [Chloroflexota bacterium]